MKADDFEELMRKGEYMHKERVLSGQYIIIRVDGRGFSNFTKDRYEKPFDHKFADMMQETTMHLMARMGAIYGYVESDEISILLDWKTELFNRSAEKLVSISAAAAASRFSLLVGEEVEFDSRLWVARHTQDQGAGVVDYFRWRQSDANRCCLNGYVYWSLRENHTARQATRMMDKQGYQWKIDFLKSYGIAYGKVPSWQRNGVGFKYDEYSLSTVDHEGNSVVAERKRLTTVKELPEGGAYSTFIRQILLDQESTPASKQSEFNPRDVAILGGDPSL